MDISQAFNKVWHTGLVYKIRLALPYNFYLLLKSYLNERYFYVSTNESESKHYPTKAGVSQGNVLGSVLY